MRPSRRLFAGAAALLALSLTATACDASPFAAKVNSQVIKQTALNAELRAWAGNSDYVTAFNSSNSTSGLTIAGDAPGTYSTTWVANILGGMIDAGVVHQQLVATGQAPSPGVEAAARSVSEISQIGWERFSPSFRQTLVARLADQATLTPASIPTTTLLGVYNHYKQYFFTRICTVQASAVTKVQAQSLAASGLPNGNQTCYDQAQFETQLPGLQSAILGLAAGNVAPPIATAYGYLVVKVASRDIQDFTPDVQRVLSTAILSAQGTPNPTLTGLIGKARVQINPAYGTWKSSQVVPPAAPGA